MRCSLQYIHPIMWKQPSNTDITLQFPIKYIDNSASSSLDTHFSAFNLWTFVFLKLIKYSGNYRFDSFMFKMTHFKWAHSNVMHIFVGKELLLSKILERLFLRISTICFWMYSIWFNPLIFHLFVFLFCIWLFSSQVIILIQFIMR